MGKSAVLEMSAPEKASADAKLLTPDMLSLLKRGSLTTGTNGEFAKAFAKQAMSGSERGGFMADDGTMSKTGEERVRNALAQRAYESSDLVSKMSEDSDPDMKAFGGALMDAAPMMAKLRGAIETGKIPKAQDLSPAIVEAANLVKRARQGKTSVSSEVAQNDAFSQRLPQTEAILKSVFGDDFSRRMSRQRFTNLLNNYADAMHNEYSMFGDSRPAATVLRDEAAKLALDPETSQARLVP